MARKVSQKKKLQEISSSKKWEGLQTFKDPEVWKNMTSEDKDLLAFLFLQQGESQLKNCDPKALDSFKMVRRLAPKNCQLWYRQAVSLAEMKNNIRCYDEAIKCLNKAIKLDPQPFEYWHLRGYVKMNLGAFHQENELLHQADEDFTEALKHIQNDIQSQKLYWDWGLTWYYLAKCSGEFYEVNKSLDYFKKADEAGCNKAEFWNGYANVLSDGAILLEKFDYVFQCLEYYERAIKIDPNFYVAWVNYGSTFQHLFISTLEDTYFRKGDAAFESACSLNSKDYILWVKWGELFCVRGRHHHDANDLRVSIEKFKRAKGLEPNDPHIFTRLGEALLACGQETENVNLMRQAQEYFESAVQMEPENSWYWYLVGSCYFSLGDYFNDSDYYTAAIEKYEFALTITPNDVPTMHSAAQAYFTLGIKNRDKDLVVQAIDLFRNSIELGGLSLTSILTDWGVALMTLADMTGDYENYEDALKVFEQRLGYESECGISIDFDTLYHYGCCWDLLGEATEEMTHFEKAIEILSKAVQVQPNHLSSRYNLAVAYTHLAEITSDVESYTHAIQHFEYIISVDQEDETSWLDWGIALLHLAYLVDDPTLPGNSQDLYTDAEAKITHAIALGNTQAFYYLGCFYSLMDNHNAAIHYLERAAHADSLPPIDDIINDEWLINLRHSHDFQLFIKILQSKDKETDPHFTT